MLQKHKHHFLAGRQLGAIVCESGAQEEGASWEPKHHLGEEGRWECPWLKTVLAGSRGSPRLRTDAYTFRYRQSSL